MGDSRSVLFVCEQYYLRFYRPLADLLARSGFRPIWVTLNGPAQWSYEYLDPGQPVERLVDSPELVCTEESDELCVFERAVFERPNLFKDNYPYTVQVARSAERARRLAEVWYRSAFALIDRFRPAAVFLWNGRYLPYSAVSAACQAAEQLFFTSEIGWIPGTIFLDRGPLSTTTEDLRGRTFESTPLIDADRAEAFLSDYTSRRATMVSQAMAPVSDVRRRLLGSEGAFLVLYGCQVDWDTNVVIGARRFRSNEAAVSFLMECTSAVPGARIVVKTHPLDSEKKEDALRDLLGEHGTVVSDVHPHVLIEAADCVVVRNSTLGFEALCYGRPLMALEPAKYKHQRLTLESGDAKHAARALSSVANQECQLPDRETLTQFVLHLLDRYLMPVGYEYHFEPAKLELLSHFSRNECYRNLQELLSESATAVLPAFDESVRDAVSHCDLKHSGRESFMRKQLRKVSERLF